MPEAELHVELLAHTPDLEKLIASAARLCYTDANILDLLEEMTPEKSQNLIKKVLKMGHDSPLEHASFTFGIEGVSRALTHQLVRHRIASYSQQSQRYVKQLRVEQTGDFKYIMPSTVLKERCSLAFEDLMKQCQEIYTVMLNRGVPAEDARYVLPNAVETKIIMTMNIRSLFNFFNKRLCNRAQWEIQALAEKIYESVYPYSPTIFDHAGPSCVAKGHCTEGEYSCGKSEEMKKKYQELRTELLAKYGKTI